MNQLPEHLINKVMLYVSHPCADIMNDIIDHYQQALEVQQRSRDTLFREAAIPSLKSFKRRGTNCAEWYDIFEGREEKELLLESLEDEGLLELLPDTHPSISKWQYWRNERALINLLSKQNNIRHVQCHQQHQPLR